MFKRWLRYAGVVALAIFVVIGTLHQLVQLGAGLLPSTEGEAIGAREVLLEHTLSSVVGRGFLVPSTHLCAVVDHYVYSVERTMHVTSRFTLDTAQSGRSCYERAESAGTVHYIPFAAGVAVADPRVSALMCLLLVVAIAALGALTAPRRLLRLFAPRTAGA